MRWTHDIEIDNNILECGIRSLYDNRNLNIHHNNVGKPSMNVEPEVGIYLCDVDYVRIWNNKFKNLNTFIEFSSFGETKLFNIYVFCNLMINSGVSSQINGVMVVVLTLQEQPKVLYEISILLIIPLLVNQMIDIP